MAAESLRSRRPILGLVSEALAARDPEPFPVDVLPTAPPRSIRELARVRPASGLVRTLRRSTPGTERAMNHRV